MSPTTVAQIDDEIRLLHYAVVFSLVGEVLADDLPLRVTALNVAKKLYDQGVRVT